MCHGRGDGFDPGHRVGNDVFLTGDVADVCCKLRDVVQMVELARRTLVPLLVKGEGVWLMVREDGEMPGLQHVAEVLHGPVDG